MSGTLLVLCGFLNATFAGLQVSKKAYGWATFSGLMAIGSFVIAAG